MTIVEIIERSKKYDQLFKDYSVRWPNENIFGTMQWHTDGVKELLPNVLYVSTVEELPKALSGNDVFNFMIHSADEKDSIDIPDLIKRRCNVLITTCSAEEAVQRMEKNIFSERKVESAMRRITEAMFVSGMKKMIAVSSEQMHCPIILADNSGTILESYKGSYPEFEQSRLDEFWDKTETADRLFEMAEKCSPEQKDVLMHATVPRAKIFRHEEYQDLIIIDIPVRVSKIEVGKIFGFVTETMQVVLEEELLYRVSQLVGDELQKHNHFHVNRRQRYVNFMWMLLEGKYPNIHSIEQAQEEFGIKFKGKSRVVLLHIIRDELENFYENDMLNVLNSQVQSKLPNVLSVIHNQDLILIFNKSENEDISDFEEKILKQTADVNNLSIGISLSAESLTGISELYWQAKEASEFGYDILKQKYTKFEDISHFSMFRLVQQKMDCMSLVVPKLKDLCFAEKENMQEYLPTLYYYLKYDGNTNVVSQKMHVHRNTVLYRIDKIQEKMGFYLGDGMSKMKLLLSCEILKYLKLFQPEE